MKRWLVHLVIVAYLGTLSAGIFCHAFMFGTGAHPSMYFIVWDMFCGWSSYASRLEIIGEGESGRYYRLAPAPWGDFKPYSKLGRRHYDLLCQHGIRLGMNCLRHTQHEPMSRIFVVEECWAKKYNLPDAVWCRIYDEPKDIIKYRKIRRVALADGTLVYGSQSWFNEQNLACIADNPRLRADVRRNRPFYTFSASSSPQGILAPAGMFESSSDAPPGTRLGE